MKAALRPAEKGGVTREALLAMAEGDAEFLRDLVETFAADARERLAELREAVAHGDAAACVAPAHALKGTVGNFSEGPAAAATRALEERARAGGIGPLADACAAVEREIEALLRELRELAASL